MADLTTLVSLFSQADRKSIVFDCAGTADACDPKPRDHDVSSCTLGAGCGNNFDVCRSQIYVAITKEPELGHMLRGGGTGIVPMGALVDDNRLVNLEVELSSVPQTRIWLGQPLMLDFGSFHAEFFPVRSSYWDGEDREDEEGDAEGGLEGNAVAIFGDKPYLVTAEEDPTGAFGPYVQGRYSGVLTLPDGRRYATTLHLWDEDGEDEPAMNLVAITATPWAVEPYELSSPRAYPLDTPEGSAGPDGA